MSNLDWNYCIILIKKWQFNWFQLISIDWLTKSRTKSDNSIDSIDWLKFVNNFNRKWSKVDWKSTSRPPIVNCPRKSIQSAQKLNSEPIDWILGRLAIGGGSDWNWQKGQNGLFSLRWKHSFGLRLKNTYKGVHFNQF